MTKPNNPSNNEEIGERDFPIWLLGDSPSVNYPDLTPLDPTHPTRHTIWTPILDVIQSQLFSKCGHRLDDSKLFIRNAVTNSNFKLEKPKNPKDREDFLRNLTDYQNEQKTQIAELKDRLELYKPFLVLCFGQFAYPFALRAQRNEIKILSPNEWKTWSIPKLSKAFDLQIKEVRIGKVTLLPLLHASAARGFKSATTHFSGKLSCKRSNYFEYVGEQIAEKLIANHKDQRLDKFMLKVKQESVAS